MNEKNDNQFKGLNRLSKLMDAQFTIPAPISGLVLMR